MKKLMSKYIFVAGGVMSGIGKGITTASIGKILQSKGFKVTVIKIDPYINIDAGTMNPAEHGEIYVTQDGTECDQDIGNYERFLDINLTSDNYITTGQVYQSVINKERNLEYNGRCVEAVPDIPNEVIFKICQAVKKNKSRGKKPQLLNKTDFVLIEIGGTVGEYQNMLFLEAARMMRLQRSKDILFILVTYLPIPEMIGEMKTKPTQQAVKWLNMAGIQPDIIIARSVVPLDKPRKRKIATFCNIVEKDVISAPDIKSIYEVPINFEKDKIGERILKKFGLQVKQRGNFKDWKKLTMTIRTVKKPVKIGIVGKYFTIGKFTLMDAYVSIIEAVKHAAWFYNQKPEIYWLSAEKYEQNPGLRKELKNYNGIIVPGGFGNRGVEGKINVIEFCRKQKIPFFGLCLGMQLAVVEFARNVCKLAGAHTTEVRQNCKYPVIDTITEQKNLLKKRKYGGTMRLGQHRCEIKPNTLSFKAYATQNVFERHRHRYELNNAFKEILQKYGMVMAGISFESDLIEIIELKNHPFFIGTQFHPEYQSRPLRPHPLFKEFIKAAIRQ